VVLEVSLRYSPHYFNTSRTEWVGGGGFGSGGLANDGPSSRVEGRRREGDSPVSLIPLFQCGVRRGKERRNVSRSSLLVRR